MHELKKAGSPELETDKADWKKKKTQVFLTTKKASLLKLFSLFTVSLEKNETQSKPIAMRF